MKRLRPMFLVYCLVLLFSLILFAQAPITEAPGPIPPSPIQPLPLPPWSYPFIVLGVNAGMEGLKLAAPKIPAWLGPFINLGLGIGLSFLGNAFSGTPATPSGTIESTAIISGGAALTHGVGKNLLRGDTLGDKPTTYKTSIKEV